MTAVQRDAIHLALVVAIVVGVCAALLPSRLFHSGDAKAMRAGAIEWLNQGRFDVPAAYAEAQGERGRWFFQHPDGRWFSKYGLVHTLLYLPPLWLEKAVVGELRFLEETPPAGRARRAAILAAWNLPFAAALAAYLFGLARLYTDRTGFASAYVLAALLASFALYYLRAQTVEIFHMLCFTAVFYHLVRCRRAGGAGSLAAPRPSPHAWAALAWLSGLVLAKLVFALLVPLAAAFLAVCDQRAGRHPPLLRFLRARLADAGPRLALRLGAPLALLAALVGAANHAWFGSPFATGYGQWESFDDPLQGSPWVGLQGFLFDPQKSAFLHFPLLALAVCHLRAWWRRDTFEAGFALGGFAALLLVSASTAFWRGDWSYGPRYLVFGLPVVGLACLLALDAPPRRRRLSLLAAAALVGAGAAPQPFVQPFDFQLPAQVQLRFQRLDDPRVDAYFRRSWWCIGADLVAFHAGRRPFPPLADIAPGLDPEHAAWLRDEIHRLVRPNLFWVDPVARGAFRR